MKKNDPEYHRVYRIQNRERLRQQARDYRRSSVARLLTGAKIRAKEKGLLFNLSADDIPIPSHCPVLGIPLSIGDGRPHDGSPSLDRFDNQLGYTVDDVRVISRRANTIKNNATLEEIEKIVEYMKNGKAAA